MPESEETAMGHPKQTWQGLRSTSKGEEDGSDNVQHTVHTLLGKQRNVIGCHVPVTKLQGIIGTDQTGQQFPATSRRGHKHIFIMCNVNVECICAVAIKGRKSKELLRASEEACDESAKCGFEPVLHRIDHKTSTELTQAIEARGLDHQIMPTGVHRQNPAERAKQTLTATSTHETRGTVSSHRPM